MVGAEAERMGGTRKVVKEALSKCSENMYEEKKLSDKDVMVENNRLNSEVENVVTEIERLHQL